MKIRRPGVWIAAFSATAVVGVVLRDVGRRPSPGPLAEVHGREEDLAGKSDCSACHGGWGQTMDDSCIECHRDVGEQVAAKAGGLHGVIAATRSTECAPCHSDHHGAGFQMVNDHSFALAGVPDVARFDHQMVGWRMDGKHLEIACDECHKHASELALPKGERRYLGLDRSCEKCHEDPHQGRMALECVDCHDQTDWNRLAFAGHERFLPLVGGHGGVACRDCHGKSDRHALERLGRHDGLAPRDCVECHASPHSPLFADAFARLVAKPPGASCVECHHAEHVSFIDERLTMTGAQHAATGFRLDKPHHRASCNDCHDLEIDRFDVRYPGRGANDCERCHVDPHDGQFKFGSLAVRGCTECHAKTTWDPHTYGADDHARTDLPLTGGHAKVKCNDCHKVPDEGSPREFHSTPIQCERCHQDAHDGYFDKLLKRQPFSHRGDCARCHLTSSFSALPARGFDHDRWTAFPLAGAHEQSDCESCHPRAAKPDRMLRTFGRVAKEFGKVEGCRSCHQDPHKGLFDAAALPKRVEGRIGCARCHDESSFRNVLVDFDHGKWTGYKLEGTHAGLGCTDCHEPLRVADPMGRTFAAAPGKQCAACHLDPHGGQFHDAKGDVDCERCHRSARSFSDLFFKHNLHSRYRLDATHARVECAGCHKPFLEGDQEIVRYRPLGMECADCHGAPQDVLRRRRERNE